MIASKDEVTDPLSLFEHAPDSADYAAEFLPLSHYRLDSSGFEPQWS
jgi:hypothetical protein